ncbi:xanthine dehydrogenase accessory protein XdhC, partial [Escherichia coli]|nr:xanthine dehydrogenase accessory protein XdhC [Escherichia coli]
MSFDRAHIARVIAEHGPVARVVVARVEGSAPREVGAAMLVWTDGQDGTIGGGALELQATQTARALLAGDRAARLDLIPLGPAVGQCCGGAVSLVTELFTKDRLNDLHGDLFARPINGPADPPLPVQRLLATARSTGQMPAPQLIQGWMVEPFAAPRSHVWIWGAGHVGRAIMGVLAPLPGMQITWVDTAADRFPAQMPNNVDRLIAPNPAQVAHYAPRDARHLILTYSHPIDLAICDAMLRH